MIVGQLQPDAADRRDTFRAKCGLALGASLAANLGLIALVVVLAVHHNGALSPLFGRRVSIRAGLDNAPAIPYRVHPRFSMTNVHENLRGEQLQHWRAEILAQLGKLLDLPSTSRGLAVNWIAQSDRSGAYRLDRGTFPSPTGIDQAVIYRLLPTRTPIGSRKPPVVLAIPGSGTHALDGLLGRVADYQRSAAVRFAEHGYAVYVPESFGIGERGFDVGWMKERGYHSQHVAGMYGLYSGRYLASIFMADLQAALQVAREDPTVDGQSIVTFGISRAAYLAIMSAVLAPDVKGAVAASGLRDADIYAPYYFDHVLIPGEGAYFLASDVAGALAPRPLLVTYGRRFETRGELFGEAFELQEEVQTLRTGKRVESIYRLFDADLKLTVAVHSQGHTWDETATYAFLRQLFGY